MNTNNPVPSSVRSEPITDTRPHRSLVPKGITIGLAIFALVLSLAGYGFRLMIGDDVGVVLRHAAVVIPTFVLGIPLFFGLARECLIKLKACILKPEMR